MTFFNKKEDVIQIELTPYGRKMLGTGKFKPVYYTFLDDDVLYDASKAGITENSHETKDRILKKTPYMKPQTNYKGVETSINSERALEENLKDEFVISERSEKLQYQLGTNNFNTKDSPEIVSTFLLGEISGSVATQYSGSNIAPINIPQINCDIEYTLSIENQNNPRVDQYGRIPDDYLTYDFKADGSYVHVEKEELLILLSEEGGFADRNGLEIEVFEFSENEDSLIPLKFDKKIKNIIDGIFYEEDELPPINENNGNRIDQVSRHMEILVDDEIPDDKICLGINILKQQNIYVDLEVNCDDIIPGFDVDLYRSSTTPDDLEEC